MEPDQPPGAGAIPPDWQAPPPPRVPDFFASGAVVMPPPEAGTPYQPPSAPPPALTYGVTVPGAAAPQPTYSEVPWGYSASAARSRSRLLVPSAMTAGVVAVGAVLVAMFGLGGGSSALSNTQMLAALHTASTGLTRAPATTFTMTINMSALGHNETVNMSGISSSDNREGTFKMTGPGVEESVLSVDGIGYVSVPATAIAMNHGKPWIGLRSPTPTAAQEALESNGPADLLKLLSTFSGTVTDEGTHTISGAQTTEYSAEVNLTSLLSSMSPQLEQSLNPSSIAIPEALMKIWIDKQGLARQLTFDLSSNGLSVNEIANFTPTDALPKVTAPPESEVQMYNSIADFTASIERAYGAAIG